MDVYQKIKKEIERSEKLHPNYPMDIFIKLAIMQEEAGEVTKATFDYVFNGDTIEHVKEELIQTAAMCIKMHESLMDE